MKKREVYWHKALRLFFRVVFSRTLIIVLMLIVQVFILFASFRWLGNYLHFIFEGMTILGALCVIAIVNSEQDSSFKLAWIIPVCIIPVFGVLMYLFVTLNPGGKGLKEYLDKRREETSSFRFTSDQVLQKLNKERPSVRQLSQYIGKMAGNPTFCNTLATYYPVGEENFKDILEELKKAEKFIFLEYFIVERGIMWNSILEILKQKVKEGVEVRVMYDGMCCLILLPYHYPKQLEKEGIKAKMFSPIVPALSTHQNNRDHRKILVIDNKIAFTGGINLADEYINEKVVYGHWKDVGIKLEGDAVKSFTTMFLEMWNVDEQGSEDYGKYINAPGSAVMGHDGAEGYVIPYGDGPTQKETVAENIYIDMLYHAREYVHIMTPYLILDDEMLKALSYAALRGVDVKLILPHIPDKKFAFYIARTYYKTLLKSGVKIYEYTPGFVHAKLFVSDHEKAVVGTVNLDFRSLYLHFECGVYLYKNKAIEAIAQDYQETLAKCQEMSMEHFRNLPVLTRIAGRILRLFAPLM